MKFIQLILVSILLLFTTQMVFAQFYIDAEGNGGLGVQTSPNAKLTIDNSIENTSLKILNKINSTTTTPKIGIGLELDSNGTSPKYGIDVTLNNNSNSNSEIVPFRANIYNYGSGTSNGFVAIVKEFGTGVKNGFFSRVTQPLGATGTIKGAYNEVKQYGSASFTYGIHNAITQQGNTGTTYGLSNIISTTSSGTSYGSYNHVYGSGSGEMVALSAWAGGNTPANNTAAKFYGKVFFNGTLYQASDENIKKDIKDLTGALALIRQMKPKKYKFKDSPYSGDNPNLNQYGFLAQEFEQILPDQVRTLKQQGRIKVKQGIDDVLDAVEYEQLEPDEDIKAVNYISLIPILTKAIQEQQAIIEDLERRLEDVEKK